MTSEQNVREACVGIWGETGTAEMEAHCAAHSMTLSDFLEAVATRPGGAADQFGLHVDRLSGVDIASGLSTARLLDETQTAQIILAADSAAMFDNPNEA